MDVQLLHSTAQGMVAPGRGILAVDESHPTIGKRFAALGIESSEETRRVYRQMFFASPEIEQYISGVILFYETIRQQSDDGTPFPEMLSGKGIIPGIKVDRGAKNLATSAGEKVTEGLDELRERLEEYFDLGARFAKWRAVITIGDGIPSRSCIEANAHGLARYAALCQEASVVPIVEPEVLMDGDHDIETCDAVTTEVLHRVFSELRHQNVLLDGIVLKPSMVISGSNCTSRASCEEVADRTVGCLRRTVPCAVPGIAFLSGGQSDGDATSHLDAMNRRGPHPWNLTFSYGRALQATAMKVWATNNCDIDGGSAAFLHRARLNSSATRGSYEPAMETATP